MLKKISQIGDGHWSLGRFLQKTAHKKYALKIPFYGISDEVLFFKVGFFYHYILKTLIWSHTLPENQMNFV
jgi:hypothetical protein